MNANQSFVIFNKTRQRIIGTDSRQPFTESAANQKMAVLAEYTKDDLEVVQLAPLFVALAE